MLFFDGPEHARLREAVSPAATGRIVRAVRPLVADVAEALLDRALLRDGRIDVVADYARPLPTVVAAELCGIPLEERDAFRSWWYEAFAVLEGSLEPDEVHRRAEILRELTGRLRAAVLRAARDRPDRMLAAIRGLSEDELVANAILLLSVGQESLTNLLGNGLLALLRHPAELDRLRADPGLVPAAVEELLRYDSPVQLITRRAAEEIELGGRTLAAGDGVVLFLGAANRDPDRHPEPDRLDLGRPRREHVSFGGGPHLCLGAALARLEARIALEAFVRRVPRFELAGDGLRWRRRRSSRGLAALPVRVL